MPAWAMISVGACRSMSRARPSAIGGKPRPPWIRIGHAALRCEREHRLEPRVVRQEPLRARVELDPARTQRRGSARPPRAGIRSGRAGRTAASAPPESAAHASVRSLAALKAGCRSGSSRQNTNDRAIPYERWIASSSSASPVIPSMSRPTCVCASNSVDARRKLRQCHGRVRVQQRVGAFECVHATPVYAATAASSRSTNTCSGTLPAQRAWPSTTTAGTEWTAWRPARAGNSPASIPRAVTRGEASAQRYASNTAGGQCGQVGVTKTSIATSASSEASFSSVDACSDESCRPAAAIPCTSVASS